MELADDDLAVVELRDDLEPGPHGFEGAAELLQRNLPQDLVAPGCSAITLLLRKPIDQVSKPLRHPCLPRHQVPTTLKPLARAAIPRAASCVANTRSAENDSRHSMAVARWMA